MARRGALILFEGVDRCGKTTQARKLAEALNAVEPGAVFMRFPDRETTIGQMINAYLTKSEELDDHAVHLLFAANRWEKRRAMLDALNAGKTVVVDRYAHSGVCFSSAKAGLGFEWCKSADEGLPQPDLILFMDLSIEAASQRGGFGGERYEVPAFQQAVRARFDALRRDVDAVDPSLWVQVDAAGTIDDIHAHVKSLATQRMQEVAATPLRALWRGQQLGEDTTSR